MFIAHRINRIEDLISIPTNMGIEIDLRDRNNKIILSHDPFIDGVEFEEFMKFYKHSFIILNIKSERIEYKVLEILRKYNITNYFFLDSSFPMIYKLSSEGEDNIAIRYSEFESISSVLKLSQQVKWVWVDCFNNFPLNKNTYDILKSNNFKICVVSPELQSQPEKIDIYIQYMYENGIIPDMVCSKIYNHEKWQKIIYN